MQEVGIETMVSQDATDITCPYTYVQTDLAKCKGLLIKIKVIEGFSAKLKVLKVCKFPTKLKVLKVQLGRLNSSHSLCLSLFQLPPLTLYEMPS